MNQEKVNTYSVLLGYISESYNNVVFGFFSVMIAPLFFPDNAYGALSGFGTFASGYLMRPFGGLIFGYIGDRYGRKTALKTSILFLAVPSFIIACLPTYDTMGIAAPLILIAGRLLQGLSHGGDYSGAIIYMFEQKVDNKVFQTCLMVSCGFIGGTLASVVGVLSNYDFFPQWTWRIPFFFGFFCALMTYVLRTKMQETAAFEQSQQTTPKTPFKEYIKPYTASLILGGTNLVPVYVNTVYMNRVLIEALSFSNQAALLVNTVILCASIGVILWAARPIQKYGEKRVLITATLMNGIMTPLLFYGAFLNEISVGKILGLQTYLMITNALQITAMTFYFPRLFPTTIRYRALGLSLPIGQALIGGTTPLFCLLLVTYTGTQSAPGLYLSLTSLLSLFALKLAEREDQERG